MGRRLIPATLRSLSQSVRNATTWFQLGVIGDAGPEITSGLGAFPYGGTTLGFGGASLLVVVVPLRLPSNSWGCQIRAYVIDLMSAICLAI